MHQIMLCCNVTTAKTQLYAGEGPPDGTTADRDIRDERSRWRNRNSANFSTYRRCNVMVCFIAFPISDAYQR